LVQNGETSKYPSNIFSSWWFFTNPFEKYAREKKIVHLPQLNRGENQKYLKITTTQFFRVFTKAHDFGVKIPNKYVSCHYPVLVFMFLLWDDTLLWKTPFQLG